MANAIVRNSTGDDDPDPAELLTSTRDLDIQAAISVALGLSAFLIFCFLRTRWTSLYAARKKQNHAASKLPELPKTFFGWIPVLFKISEDEVLASAGLDAYVFLHFFKMALKFLLIVLFFSWTVIYPVYQKFGKEAVETESVNENVEEKIASGHDGLKFARQVRETNEWPKQYTSNGPSQENNRPAFLFMEDKWGTMDPKTGYLWIYVVFVYIFSLALIYLIITETKKVISIRQKYLSAQSSITDRTIRLSGIPRHLRDEEKIKETIENLQMGKVESVTLCRNWVELDKMMDQRMTILRKLEEAWTVHLGSQVSSRDIPSVQHRASQTDSDDGERQNVNTPLLENGEADQSHISASSGARPTVRLRTGFMQSRSVDAIEYYEEQLHDLDARIRDAREATYDPTPLAFVTLDSIAACQMATQAILDPEPMQLIATPAPAPADVIWPNTYLPRRNRMLRAWSITAIILVSSILWLSILFPLAVLLNLKTIRQFLPTFADFLEKHQTLQSLVRTLLPTTVMSLLNLAVPYLYYWLSSMQGMTSEGEVEMSVISKNFFFTFFNLFVAFTVIGTASTLFQLWDLVSKLKERFGDVLGITLVLARSLKGLSLFYQNLILLQGIGLFPLRLLELGSVMLHPFFLIGSKTPRDYAELFQPPIFSYGFFLPSSLFVFSICIVYSALPDSQFVPVFGIIYFILGHFVYKYQLLYAMDHPHFSTGRAWPMICIRVIVALIFFQVAMAGQLALNGAIPRSILVAPLFIGTIWFAFSYQRTYEPLMRFIALRSLHEAQDDTHSLSGSRIEEMNAAQASPDDESNRRFVNPSLITPLDDVWIARSSARDAHGAVNGQAEQVNRTRLTD